MATDWARARTIAPLEVYNSADWVQHWKDNPDVFTRMLGDVYRVYKTEQAKRRGTANSKGGRRRSVIDGNVEELFEILTPVFSTEPFHISMPPLMEGISQRQLAKKVRMDQTVLSRWLNNDPKRKPPDRYTLERLAKALGVHPSYFLEWRRMVLIDLLTEILEVNPNLSISLLKAVS